MNVDIEALKDELKALDLEISRIELSSACNPSAWDRVLDRLYRQREDLIEKMPTGGESE